MAASSPSVSPRIGVLAADSNDMSSTLATADAVELPSAASIFSASALPRSATCASSRQSHGNYAPR
jgi:hypothetical protein